MNIGHSIKILRVKYNYAQGEFAELIGLSQSGLSKIENSRANPTYDTLTEISLALDVPLPVLLWFGISEDDVSDEKLDSYRLLKPILDELLFGMFKKVK